MTGWFIAAGFIALVMAFATGQIRRIPLSTSIVYLGAGYLLGPHVLGLLDVNPQTHSKEIESIVEIVIVISIFSSALKLRLPVLDKRWFLPLRLVFISMGIGMGGLVAVGYFLFQWPIALALLMAAILVPTDPVLASDVQVEQPFQFHALRFALTGEAGFNDGAALPLVTFGLALLGVERISSGWRWFLLHVIWGFLGAVLIGAVIGYLAMRILFHLWMKQEETYGTPFLALGLIGLSYGLTTEAHAIGFVAVFAAGVAARKIEQNVMRRPPDSIEVKVAGRFGGQIERNAVNTSVFMLLRMLFFTETLERIGEAVVVVLLGALLQGSMLEGPGLVCALLLFFVIRPVSVFVGLLGSRLRQMDRAMVGWFGIRGMASVYYLAYIHTHGAAAEVVQRLAQVVVGVVVYSILAHGVTATPLMAWFEKRTQRDSEAG